ncbi:MAG: hypothetical protein GC171_15450 [Terrimonas sp.]|nr:hypothetical protein [Terrimonas sp.]
MKYLLLIPSIFFFSCHTKIKDKLIEVSIDGQTTIKVPDNIGLYKPNDIILVRVRTVDKNPETNVYFAWGKYSEWAERNGQGTLPPTTTEYKGSSRIDTWYTKAIVLYTDEP